MLLTHVHSLLRSIEVECGQLLLLRLLGLWLSARSITILSLLVLLLLHLLMLHEGGLLLNLLLLVVGDLLAGQVLLLLLLALERGGHTGKFSCLLLLLLGLLHLLRLLLLELLLLGLLLGRCQVLSGSLSDG